MKFKIKNGRGIVKISGSGQITTFENKGPVAAYWGDYGGSVGCFFASLGHNKDYLDTFLKKLELSIFENFLNREEELKSILDPLFEIFNNGDYEIKFFDSNKEHYKYTSSADNYEKEYFSDWYVLTSNRNKKGWFYGGSDENFISTKSLEEIDQTRVNYFKDIIKKGKRPFAILFNNLYIEPYGFTTEKFIIDGHHKLLAYKKLSILPPHVLITKINKNNDSGDSLYEALNKVSAVLGESDFNNLVNYSKIKEETIEAVLDSDNTELRKFIRDGEHYSFYPDGILKSITNYNQGIKHGKQERWYHNGQKSEETFFENDKIVGCSKSWHISPLMSIKGIINKILSIFSQNLRIKGKISSVVYHYEEEGQRICNLCSYYENGKLRSKINYKNGTNKDGFSDLSWHPNGVLSAKLKYKNGELIERFNYNDLGEETNHDFFNEGAPTS